MIPLITRLLLCLVIWATTISAFTFTNSFDGWVGNTTYTITWRSSTSDPMLYNLVLVRPHNISNAGVEVNATWPMDWSMRVATQIPSFGDQLFRFTLPVDCQPGYYYWVMQTDQNIPVSTTFLIANSPSVAPSSTQSALTISSFVPVTATQSVIGTSDGQLVTYKPSDVFSSAVVYTTIIVTAEGRGKGMPRGKMYMIIGVTLAALFLITMPIVVWLVLRYRRQPIEPYNSSGTSDKRIPGSGVECQPSSSALDLLALDTTGGDPFASNSAISTRNNHQMWTIADGEKRQANMPRYPPRPAHFANIQDPFADPLLPSRQQSLSRITIPQNSSESHNSAPPSSTPIDAPSSHGATVISHTAPGVMHVRNGTSAETQTDVAQLGEKASRPRRPRSTQEAQPLSPEEASSRIFIPGRAVDMGPLGRSRFGDVDENGLLPPDYSQATQPIRPPQAGPGGR